MRTIRPSPRSMDAEPSWSGLRYVDASRVGIRVVPATSLWMSMVKWP